MSNIPLTKDELANILDDLSLNHVDELFNIIPDKFKLDYKKFNIPEGLSEQEVYSKLSEIGKKNKCGSGF